MKDYPNRSLGVHSQGGYALVFFLAIITMGLLYSVVGGLSATQQKLADANDTNSALAQAKEALIGYAASSSNPASLPCPDRNDPVSQPVFYGYESASCANLGRLPFKTLGLAELPDRDGERFWYAVSTSFRKDIGTANSDTSGTITVVDSNGNTVATDVVAVIIAPGAPLPRVGTSSTQNRSASNYLVATEYLDNTATTDNASFNDDTNKSIVAGPAMNTQGEIIANDRIAYITRNELMAVIEKRVGKEVTTCLSAYAATNGVYPWPTPLADNSGNYIGMKNSYFGHLPKTQPIDASDLPAAIAATISARDNIAGASDTSQALSQLSTQVLLLKSVAYAIQVVAQAVYDQASIVETHATNLVTAANSYISSATASNETALISSVNTTSTQANVLANELLLRGLDAYPWMISTTALDATNANSIKGKTAVLVTQRALYDVARTTLQATPNSANAYALANAATTLRSAIGTTTSGVRTAISLTNSSTTSGSAYWVNLLLSGDNDIASARNNVLAPLINPTTVEGHLSTARTSTSTARTAANNAGAFPTAGNISTALSSAATALTNTDTALTALQGAGASSILNLNTALSSSFFSARSNIGVQQFESILTSYTTSVATLTPDSWNSPKAYQHLADVTTNASALQSLISILSSGSSSVTTAANSTNSALSTAVSSLNNAATLLTTPTATTAEKTTAFATAQNSATSALSMARGLDIALKNTNSSWATVISLVGSDTSTLWPYSITWQSATNLTTSLANFRATPSSSTATTLRNEALKLQYLANRIKTFATTVSTAAVATKTAADSASSAIAAAQANASAANLSSALTSVDALLSQAASLNTLANQGLAMPGNYSTNWPNNSSIDCRWLNQDQISWWNNNNWRSLVFFQKKNATTLTIDGTGSHDLVVVTAGPPLVAQTTTGTTSRTTLQVVASYLEAGNADSSRNGLAQTAVTTFVTELRSGSFNDQVTHP